MQNAGLAVAADSAWVVSADGLLVRVGLTDGHQQGSVRYTLARCYSAPAVVGDTLVAGDQDGMVHGIRLPACGLGPEEAIASATRTAATLTAAAFSGMRETGPVRD